MPKGQQKGLVWEGRVTSDILRGDRSALPDHTLNVSRIPSPLKSEASSSLAAPHLPPSVPHSLPERTQFLSFVYESLLWDAEPIMG